MGNKRKLFHEPSDKQKKRRLDKIVEIKSTHGDIAITQSVTSLSEEVDNIENGVNETCNKEDLVSHSAHFSLSGPVGGTKAMPMNEVLENDAAISTTSSIFISTNSNNPSAKDLSTSQMNDCKTPTDSLANVLANWLIKEKKVPHSAIDRLLQDLCSKNYDVPRSSKSLIKHGKINIVEFAEGDYFHCDEWISNIVDFLNVKQYSKRDINL